MGKLIASKPSDEIAGLQTINPINGVSVTSPVIYHWANVGGN